MKYLGEKTSVVALVYLMVGAGNALAARIEVDRAVWKQLAQSRGIRKLTNLAVLRREPVRAKTKEEIKPVLEQLLAQNGMVLGPEKFAAELDAQHAKQLRLAEESNKPLFADLITEDLETGKPVLDERSARGFLAGQFKEADPVLAAFLASASLVLKTVVIDGQERQLIIAAGRELPGFSSHRDSYLFLELPTGIEMTHGYVEQAEFAAN